MFMLMKFQNGWYSVYDTEDRSTNNCTEKEINEYLDLGLYIEGIARDGKKLIVYNTRHDFLDRYVTTESLKISFVNSLQFYNKFKTWGCMDSYWTRIEKAYIISVNGLPCIAISLFTKGSITKVKLLEDLHGDKFVKILALKFLMSYFPDLHCSITGDIPRTSFNSLKDTGMQIHVDKKHGTKYPFSVTLSDLI